MCTDEINGYTCTCDPGYAGVNCEENFDECGSNPCQHGGTCIDLINGYTCNCYPAYQGTHCAERNDLFDVKYTLEEHQSIHVSIKSSLVLSRLNCARIYIDECVSNQCQHGGMCTNEINGYSCTCDSGYAGVNCEENINECDSSPCQHSGTCTDGINEYMCACVPGYTGSNCEENFDECGSNPCQHGGTCTDVINGYTCNCYPAYHGTDCAERHDLFDVKYTLEEHQSTHVSIKSSLVLSRLKCARMCTFNPDCYGFDYNVTGHTCQMISAISTRAFGKVNYYVKHF
ncbi:fibropellin-1-like [Mytilus trossulus]|uniref:fibropellin-1-like n=1 Tax=Mytilus trossulus TaxID=6551 RepID=UPI0030070180